VNTSRTHVLDSGVETADPAGTATDATGAPDTTGASPQSDNGVALTQCEETTYLTPRMRAEVAVLYPEVDPDLVADDLMCHLGQHTEGEHYAIVYDHLPGANAGALWTRWTDDFPTTVLLRPDCPSHSPELHVPCGHFAAHPGPHSWQTEGRA
jgi:hypothetical protein